MVFGYVPAWKKAKRTYHKGKPTGYFALLASTSGQCQDCGLMKAGWISMASLAAVALVSGGFAQTFAPSPNRANSQIDLQILAKKIDEQNAKIDMLSQQILKLQQQIAASSKPGVMIGEATPAPSSSATISEPTRTVGNGNTHIVARGETLIAIAKAHGVSVTDLQKANHIDNPTKLQAGQTIVIPSTSSPAPSGSPGD